MLYGYGTGLSRTQITSLIGECLTDDFMPMWDGSKLVDAPVQLIGDVLTFFVDIEVPSSSIKFTDAIKVSEANSFLRITNTQFPDTDFDLVDARSRRTGASSLPRYFHLLESQNIFDASLDETTQITSNPHSFSAVTSNDAQTNEITVKTFAAMSNVRFKFYYTAAPNAEIRYIPSKAAWVQEEGGIDLVLGENVIDLGVSPFRLFIGDSLSVEIRADNMALLGSAAGVIWLKTMLQRGEFRDVALTNHTGHGFYLAANSSDENGSNAQALSNGVAVRYRIPSPFGYSDERLPSTSTGFWDGSAHLVELDQSGAEYVAQIAFSLKPAQKNKLVLIELFIDSPTPELIAAETRSLVKAVNTTELVTKSFALFGGADLLNYGAYFEITLLGTTGALFAQTINVTKTGGGAD